MDKQKLVGRLIDMSEIPKKRRNVTPRAFKVLPQWAEAMRLMAEDAIGVGQAYEMPVPQSIFQEGEFKDLKAVARPIKANIKSHYKSKYQVRIRSGDEPRILICRPRQRTA